MWGGIWLAPHFTPLLPGWKVWGTMGRLTATAVKANLLKPGTYQDGDGLFLKVRSDRAGGAGSAQWLVRIQRDGKRQDVGLGSAKTVTLAQARAKADELRNAVKVGKRDVLRPRQGLAFTRSAIGQW